MKVKKKYHLELDYSLIVCFGWGFFKIPLKHLFLRNAFSPAIFYVEGIWELAQKLLEMLGSAVGFS